jgi:hypothetical protein
MNDSFTTSQTSFDFPVGYYAFHKDKHANFQLNRWHSLGYWTKADAEKAGQGIKGLKDWKPALMALAKRMMAE